MHDFKIHFLFYRFCYFPYVYSCLQHRVWKRTTMFHGDAQVRFLKVKSTVVFSREAKLRFSKVKSTVLFSREAKLCFPKSEKPKLCFYKKWKAQLCFHFFFLMFPVFPGFIFLLFILFPWLRFFFWKRSSFKPINMRSSLEDLDMGNDGENDSRSGRMTQEINVLTKRI